MPVANISGAKAKFGRAIEHFEELEREVKRWILENAEALRPKVRSNGPWQVVEIMPLPPFPTRLALLSGDCVQNFRSVLDYLVWQFVLREGQKPGNRHQFPIIKLPDDWTKQVVSPKRGPERSPLYGIPQGGDAWTLIEDAQPFKAANPDWHSLTVLAHLSNIDKHRTLHVQLVFHDLDLEIVQRCFGFDPSDAAPIETLIAPPGPLSFEGPTELVRFRFDPPAPRVYVKNPLPVSPTVGDEEGHLSVAALRAKIGERVKAILEQAAKLPNVAG